MYIYTVYTLSKVDDVRRYLLLFGCANDEQFLDEINEDGRLDYDLHYCESHDSYYCPEVNFCNPDKNCFPAMNQCKAYRKLINKD